MFEFLEKEEGSPSHSMQLLLNSHIHLVSTFLVAVLESEFVLTCATHFDKGSRTIKDDDSNTIIRLDAEAIDKIFKVPTAPVYADISINGALDHYNQKRSDCIRHINSKWLKTPRTYFSQWPKLYRLDLIEDINDMITLLSRIMGLKPV